MGVIRLLINRPVMTTMLVLSLVVIGLYMYFDIPVDRMPNIEIPYATVNTIYPGAGPEEIESTITRILEEEISTVSGIKAMTSYSLENVSTIVIEFNMDEKIDVKANDVRDKVDAVAYRLPADARKPSILKIDIGAFPIVFLALSGPVPARELYRYADEELKAIFSRVPGVAAVTITGGQERVIWIDLQKSSLDAYGLTFDNVLYFIRANNIDMPAGNFQSDGFEYSLRLEGQFQSIDEIRELKIPTQFGPVRLRDLGSIVDGSEPVREIARYKTREQKNNDLAINTVGLSILKQGDANTIQTANELLRVIDSLRGEIPPNFRLDIIRDTSTWIKEAVSDTLSAIYLGIAFVGIILIIFLQDWRSALIAAVSIPSSIIASFIAMSIGGFSINIMTLMAFSVSIGTLVTNSIVVLENIIYHIRQKRDESLQEATISGTAEILLAVASSAFTNVVVFLPIAFMKSLMGAFFKEFGLTVTFATLFSLLMSFTFTPLLSSRLLKQKDKRNIFSRGFDNLFDRFTRGYSSILGLFLRSKTVFVISILIVFILLVGALRLAGVVGGEFLPRTDEGQVEIMAEFPLTYDIERTNEILMALERRLEAMPEVVSVYTRIGYISDVKRGVNMGRIQLGLVPKNQRNQSSEQIAMRVRDYLFDIPDITFSVSGSSSGGPPSEAPIVIDINGPDLAELQRIADKAVIIASRIKGAIDVESNFRTGKPEIKVIPDKDRLSLAGLTSFQLAMLLRGSVEGLTANEYREGGQEYDIKVRMEERSHDNIDKIKQLPLMVPGGVNIALIQMAAIELGTAPTRIIRKDKARSISILAHNEGRSVTDVTNDIRTALEQGLDLPYGYSLRYAGEMQEFQEAAADFIAAFFLAVILTYMLLAAMLESLVQPMIILMTIPLSFIGIFPALYITGNTLNILSMMAIVMLVGIVVNNAILMFDYTNLLHRKKGMKIIDSLLIACPLKLKPIMMSNIAIILGMLPTAMGLGEGAELRAPLAIAAIGGLISSTLLTLFIVPQLYRFVVATYERVFKIRIKR